MKAIKILLLLILCSIVPCKVHASAALLLEEPFGTFGYLNPTGHAAVYLSDVCADTPTHLRRCEAGETGVVISRYHRVDGYDWLAMPLVPYLYAVDSLNQVPSTMSPAREFELRDNYRREHLLSLAPDRPDGRAPGGEWIQLVGASYDRKIFVYQVDTAGWQDDAFIAMMNARKNKSQFNLLFRNCADLSRTILNNYYPGSVHKNFTADLGLTTPKQVARSLRKYAERREALDFRSYVLPQVSGTISRSHPVDGVIESFLKTKYVVPVAVFQPAIAGGLALDYLLRGRFNPGRDATTLEAVGGVRLLMTADDAENTATWRPALGFSADGATRSDVSMVLAGVSSGAASR